MGICQNSSIWHYLHILLKKKRPYGFAAVTLFLINWKPSLEPHFAGRGNQLGYGAIE
jgi:hypothetical protein